MKNKEHKHIWKYVGNGIRHCEAPFPTIESCGKVQVRIDGEWKDRLRSEEH